MIQDEIQDMNSMKSQSESLAKEYDRLDFYETNHADISMTQTNMICMKQINILTS